MANLPSKPWDKAFEEVTDFTHVIVDNGTKKGKKITKATIKDVLAYEGALFDPIAPGATAATATVIPSGPTGVKREWSPAPGYYKVGTTTYNVTADNDWKFYWNGTAWTLRDLGPKPDSSSKIAEFSAGTYPKDTVKTVGTTIYRAKVATSQAPSATATDWEVIGGDNNSEVQSGISQSEITPEKNQSYSLTLTANRTISVLPATGVEVEIIAIGNYTLNINGVSKNAKDGIVFVVKNYGSKIAVFTGQPQIADPPPIEPENPDSTDFTTQNMTTTATTMTGGSGATMNVPALAVSIGAVMPTQSKALTFDWNQNLNLIRIGFDSNPENNIPFPASGGGPPTQWDFCIIPQWNGQIVATHPGTNQLMNTGVLLTDVTKIRIRQTSGKVFIDTYKTAATGWVQGYEFAIPNSETLYGKIGLASGQTIAPSFA